MFVNKSFTTGFCCALYMVTTLFSACKENNVEPAQSSQKPVSIEVVAQMNRDIADMQQMLEGKRSVQSYSVIADNACVMNLDNDHRMVAYKQGKEGNKSFVPVAGIDADGYWIYHFNDVTNPLMVADEKAAALSSTGKGVYTPVFRVNDHSRWEVSLNGTHWRSLGTSIDQPSGTIPESDFSPFASFQENAEEKTLTLGLRYGGRNVTLPVIGQNETPAWTAFKLKSGKNVLLDYSYAGYMHGEVEPPTPGYPYVNVRERMQSKKMTAREALLDIMKEYKLDKGNATANIVIYFPAGDYVLHNEDDNTLFPGKTDVDTDSKGNNTSTAITMLGGNFVIKGDGVNKTRLIMDAPNLPEKKSQMWTSPDMIMIKCSAWWGKGKSAVTGEASKGDFSIEVADASPFKTGDWVCLYLQDNNPDLVKKELSPYEREATMTNIANVGVQVQDYHQIASINGNTITFVEPMMHEVTSEGKWELREFRHYENVGVEDLTFVGKAKDDFKHHGSWQDDGAYKPVSFMRLVNSWMRRVNFHSVSEASSIISCANFSAYTITIDGTRGHSAIRSQASSRVFIGKVKDISSGKAVDSGQYMEAAGQYHAVGVSKPSMGAVIWRCQWGNDACFESHATQPRATLFDCCTGGFIQFRQGGALEQLPNHLNDLTLWNFSATVSPKAAAFDWWSKTSVWWKILPPVIVGFHGVKTNFVQEQVKLDEANGQIVEPESLYEAQLKLRLGAVPAWLKALK